MSFHLTGPELRDKDLMTRAHIDRRQAFQAMGASAPRNASDKESFVAAGCCGVGGTCLLFLYFFFGHGSLLLKAPTLHPCRRGGPKLRVFSPGTSSSALVNPRRDTERTDPWLLNAALLLRSLPPAECVLEALARNRKSYVSVVMVGICVFFWNCIGVGDVSELGTVECQTFSHVCKPLNLSSSIV